MSKLNLQKKLAADVMNVGQSKVWITPDKDKLKDVQAAITRADVSRAIKKGLIKRRPDKVRMPVSARELKRRKKRGSRKGSQYARLPKKRRWIATVRPLRAMLKEHKLAGEVDNATYRKLYMLIKGGQFRSRSHMRIYMEQHGMLKKKAQ
jgi:large subunit ribosomal protein L19e